MSLEKQDNRINDKAKYEFMQELGILPNEREQKYEMGSQSKKFNVSKNRK